MILMLSISKDIFEKLNLYILSETYSCVNHFAIQTYYHLVLSRLYNIYPKNYMYFKYGIMIIHKNDFKYQKVSNTFRIQLNLKLNTFL